MKIVQVVGWYFPDSVGGTEVYVQALCDRLRARGHSVWVAAPRPGQAGVQSCQDHEVPVFRYPTPLRPTRLEAQGETSVRGAEHLHRWLNRIHPDVVHLHTYTTGVGLSELRAARVAGARVIATTHSSALGWICQRGDLMAWGSDPCDGTCKVRKCAACALHARGLPRPFAKTIAAVPMSISAALGRCPTRIGTALGMSAIIGRNQQRQRDMLACVDRFVVLTNWAFRVLIANGAPSDKLALNQLGYSQKIVRKPGPEARPTEAPVRIGYLGRYEDVKGVRDLARAARLVPHDVDFRLEFRGPAVTRPELALRHELQAICAGDARVVFAAPVPLEEVPEVLASWDVLCCPARCAEGGPTVAIEAHAAGTPVIGTRIGGLAELVSDGVNGQLVSSGDVRALADLLRSVAEDPSRIDRWRRALPNARTMDEVAADYLKLYAS